MTDGGQLQLKIVFDGERIVGATVHSTRPLAAHLLTGRPLSEAVGLVPRLFSLCGQAQGTAARLAAAAACGEEWQHIGDALARQVALEAIGEHLWRLLLDWPALLGQTARRDDFVRWRQRLLLAGKSEAATAECAGSLAEWLDAAGLEDVPESAVASPAAASLLPWLGAGEWSRQDFDASFSSEPRHAGRCCETGALARLHAEARVGASLAAGQLIRARVLARRIELHALAQILSRGRVPEGWLDAASPAPGVGVARVETARGLLLHMTKVNDGRVGRYVIVAPTEWNFHPQGCFVREAVGVPVASHEAAQHLARQLALSLDPCVAFGIAVEGTRGT